MYKGELPHGDEFIKYEVDITPDPLEWQLAAAKTELAETDYYTLKFIDGELTAEEYEPHRVRRAELRQAVRNLEPLVAAELEQSE